MALAKIETTDKNTLKGWCEHVVGMATTLGEELARDAELKATEKCLNMTFIYFPAVFSLSLLFLLNNPILVGKPRFRPKT